MHWQMLLPLIGKPSLSHPPSPIASTSIAFICKDPPQSLLFTQSYLILCDPMDCSPPDSSVRGISQARALSGVPALLFRTCSRCNPFHPINCPGTKSRTFAFFSNFFHTPCITHHFKFEINSGSDCISSLPPFPPPPSHHHILLRF